jgi:hypothetical protein
MRSADLSRYSVGSHLFIFHFDTFTGCGCAILFRALRTALLVVGDGMRKKDTEIPPKRVFI